MGNKIIAYTDGGSRGNPGPAASGVFIEAFEGDQKIWEKKYKKFLGTATNNIAEYRAMVMALTELARLAKSGDEIEVRTDSELMHRQIIGVYKVKDANLKLSYSEVKSLQEKLNNISFKHIPREQNSSADTLVNEALDENL